MVENAGYPDLIHRRALFFVDRKYFVIVDEAFGEGNGNVDIHFQFAPGAASFDYQQLTARTAFREGWNVLVQTVAQDGLKMEEEEGQVSFIYTKKEPRPAFRYRLRKETRGVRFVTVVAPFSGEAPDIKAKILGKPEIGGSRITLKVSENGRSKRIGYDFSTN